MKTMTIWVITFCPSDDMTTVKIAYSEKEADYIIRSYFGDILIDLTKDNALNGIQDYIGTISMEKDPYTGFITYAEWGKTSKEYITVCEELIEIKT